MTAITNQPLTLYRGEHRTWDITVVRDDDGSAEDLTSALLLEFQIKTGTGAADPALVAKAIGSGITLLAQTGATKGKARLILLPADTDALAAGVYWFDVVVQFPSNVRKYVVKPNKATLHDVVNRV